MTDDAPHGTQTNTRNFTWQNVNIQNIVYIKIIGISERMNPVSHTAERKKLEVRNTEGQ